MAFTKAQLDAYIQGLYDDDGQLDSDDNQLIINYILSNGNPELDPRDLIQIRRGDELDLPNLAQGELGFTLDKENLFVGGLNGNVKIGKTDVYMVAELKGDGIADDSNDLQNILDSEPKFKTVVVPHNKRVKITKPIIVPYGTSLIGLGNSTVFEPDYSIWQGLDYRCLIVQGRNGEDALGESYNRKIGNFSIIGKNTNLVEAIAIDISTSIEITKAQAVNYSVIFAQFDGIAIRKFDTGLNIQEAWMCTFDNISILDCRIGINIEGKSVNNSFKSGVKMTNFTNNYTTSLEKTIGLKIDSGFHYIDGEGRPEGYDFNGVLIFGANNNIFVNRVLFCRFTDCIIDGASETSVIIGSPNNITFKGCYIYTGSETHGCMLLNGVAVSDSKITVTDCYFIGENSAYGIESTANPRVGCEFSSNFFMGLKRGINLNNFNKGKIKNNYGRDLTGELIRNTSGGSGTIIDGNVSDDSFPIIICQPSTSKELNIGINYSASNKTYFKGYAILLAGQTTVTLPNGFFNGAEYYYRALTKVSPEGNVGNYWVTNFTNWTAATFNCSVAPVANTKIYYEAIAIPQSLVV